MLNHRRKHMPPIPSSESSPNNTFPGVEKMEGDVFLAAIVESSSDAIITKNLSGIITSWNRSAERIFGYTASEVIGQPITILFPPDHINEETQIIQRIKNGELVEHYETIRRR